MIKSPEKLLHDALELSSEERGELVLNLLDSLDADSPQESDKHERWLVEIERRAQNAVDGETGISWEQALTLVEQRLVGR